VALPAALEVGQATLQLMGETLIVETSINIRLI